MGSHAKIRLVAGTVAPRYDHGTELALDEVVITEQGTEGRLPIVDLKMRGPDGKVFVLVVTGRILNGISAAVKGVNLRIHGKAEP